MWQTVWDIYYAILSLLIRMMYVAHHADAAPYAETPRCRYTGYKPGAEVLQKGSMRREGARPLADILHVSDVSLKLRDGVLIYILT